MGERRVALLRIPRRRLTAIPLFMVVAAFVSVFLLAVSSPTRVAEASGSVGSRWMNCGSPVFVEGDESTWTVLRSAINSSSKDFERWRARIRSSGITSGPAAQTNDYTPDWSEGGTQRDTTSSDTSWDFTVTAVDDDEVEGTESFKYDFYESRITHSHRNDAFITATHSHNAGAHPDGVTVCYGKIIDNDFDITISEPQWGKWHTAGETIEFTATFGEAVDWLGGDDDRHLEFQLWPESRDAAYVSGRGTDEIKFAYTVEADDLDVNGISIWADALKGGDLYNVAANILFDPKNKAFTNIDDQRIDGSILDASTGLAAEHDAPWGIVVDTATSTAYVGERDTSCSDARASCFRHSRRIFAYEFPAGGSSYTRKPSEDFDRLTLNSNWDPRGIWIGTDGSKRMYIVNGDDLLGFLAPARIDAFNFSGERNDDDSRRTKTHTAEDIEGLWGDFSDSANRRMYATSIQDGSIRAYRYPTGGYVNHDDNRKIDLDDDNAWPRGVWSNGETIWVADSADDKLYAYVFTPGDTRGDRDGAKDIDLHAANGDARGIWSDGRRMYVVDRVTRRVFEYSLNIDTPWYPTALTAAAAGSSQIDLAWTAPTDVGTSAITGYKIENSTDSGTTWTTVVADTASTGTTYSHTGLAAATTYTYQVSAVNTHGAGDPSPVAEATTNPAVNRAPQVLSSLSDHGATVGRLFNTGGPGYGFFSDPDGDTLTYTATQDDDSALPSWLTFNAGIAIHFRGRPANADAAAPLDVKVTATDPDGLSASFTFTITFSGYVDPADQPPTVANAIADQSGYIGGPVSLSVSGTITDPTSDPLTYSVDKPSPDADWLVWDSTALTLAGTIPASMAQDDSFDVTVSATDTTNRSAEYTFSVTSDGVDPGDSPPSVATAIADQEFYIGDAVDLSVSGTITDPAGETLTFSVTKPAPGADWLVWDGAALTLTGTVPESMTKDLVVSVTVSAADPAGQSAEYTFTVTSLGEWTPDVETLSTLVSNLDQQAHLGYSQIAGRTRAVKFSTGGQAALVKAVTVTLRDPDAWTGDGAEPAEDVYDVQIWADDGGDPGRFVGQLASPVQITGGENVYSNQAGISLDADSTYYLVFNCDDGHCPRPLATTNSDDEDSDGASGWGIADDSLSTTGLDFWQRAHEQWCADGRADACDYTPDPDSVERSWQQWSPVIQVRIEGTLADSDTPSGGL